MDCRTSSFPSTTASTSRSLSPSVQEAAGSRPRPPPSRRRDKQQLSCNLCRRRKLRCDRQRPCQTCSTRGLSLSCEYPNDDSAGVGGSRPQATVQGRLVQLEQLVVSLMHGTTRQMPPAVEDNPFAFSGNLHALPTSAWHTESLEDVLADSPQVPDAGNIQIGPSEVRYVSSAHWAAILDSIADLKEHVDTEEQVGISTAICPRVPFKYVQLLYGCRPASRDEILDALPPKSIVDRYISHYFNTLDVAPSTIHSVKFLREYGIFWQSPSDSPMIWVGLLFSMICLSVLGSDPSLPAEEQQTLIEKYREKAVQCLSIGEYTKGGPLVFETLCHYLHIELSIHKDANKDLWLLLGVVINMVLRMGYHRDPSHFPGISPFEGEMRRRAWATCIQGDILISSQMGMPRMIKDCIFDTKEPRNLNDTDFDEDSPELPPSRSESEMTTVLQIIARRRIYVALGAVADLTASVKLQSYGEVMKVDQLLKDAGESIPAALRMKSMAACLAAESVRIVLSQTIRPDLSLSATDWHLQQSGSATPIILESLQGFEPFSVPSTPFGEHMEMRSMPLTMSLIGDGLAFEEVMLSGIGMSAR